MRSDLSFCKSSRRIAILVLALCASLLALSIPRSAAFAEEGIKVFSSEISVEKDSSLKVTERLLVNAEGDEIRRGIFRDIPVFMTGEHGQSYKVSLQVLSVKRDGHSEPYSVSEHHHEERIRIGDAGKVLKPGQHIYEITYRMRNVMRAFEDHDEVYWNVTGNDWDFAIDRAVAQVTLPDGGKINKVTAYTGDYGARGRDYEAAVDKIGHAAFFATTRRLAPGEGLSIVVSMPKGVVQMPGTLERLWVEYPAGVIGFGGLVLGLIYFLLVWVKVGRDPRSGTIIPLFEAPKGLSPALANFIWGKGQFKDQWRALSAACISLAIKGRLEFEEKDAGLTLHLKQGGTNTPEGRAKLAAGEAAIVRKLKGIGGTLVVSRAHYSDVSAISSAFAGAIKREFGGKLFRWNSVTLLPCMALVVLIPLAMIKIGHADAIDLLYLFPMVVLTIVVWIMTSVVMLGIWQLFGKQTSTTGPGTLFKATVSIVVIFVAMGIMFKGIVALPILPFMTLLTICMNVVFVNLMWAPTLKGRKLLDQVEGLRLYLEVAEKDRMNAQGAPEMKPQHFEALLPYAMALCVERPWTRAFSKWWLNSASGANGNAYHPTWFAGAGFGSAGFADPVFGSIGDMANTFAATVPPSSSSGSSSSGSSGFSSGGGFSGGGGGGGGGGGW